MSSSRSRLRDSGFLYVMQGYEGNKRFDKNPMVLKPNEVPTRTLLSRTQSMPATSRAATSQNPFGLPRIAPPEVEYDPSMHAIPGYIGFKPHRIRY
mmetsp:Transcript_18217/g.41169  ORF Transcript_18217/g.41169 Transcript_18217/m.41169 type:complete len:96 (+) Transcript_18217:73-360(+)